jgi:hypothetical protein
MNKEQRVNATRAAIEGVINEWDTMLENGRKVEEFCFCLDVLYNTYRNAGFYGDMYGANSQEVKSILDGFNDDVVFSICGRRSL